LVEGAAVGAKLPQAKREELIAVLVNLSQGARFLTTHGRLRSSYLRSQPLLEQLLSGLQPRFKSGDKVGPNWTLDRYLGHGAFGVVWMARNPHFPEPRAYKFFLHDAANEWLLREQKRLYYIRQKLSNEPHIVSFLDVAVDGGQSYLALEYVGGGSLEDWILEDASQRPPLNRFALIEATALALAKAHAAKIYHRDLKPANILLTEGPDVQPKISDFGLASIPRPGSAQVSQEGQAGTPLYLPPEAQGMTEAVDPAQQDVFAFGVIWYQLLMGRLERPPYDFAEQMRDIGADSGTVKLIARCLAQPQRRFKDAQELADALSEAELPPEWTPPSGLFDVQHLVREYLAAMKA
jgi:serine/threonine protein kinase